MSKLLSDCVKFVSGGTPSKEREDYWNGDFPWVTVKDMKSLWLTDSGLKLTSAGKAAAAVVPAESVLVLTRGMALLKDLPVAVSKRELSFNQDIKALLPVKGINAEFLAFQLLGRKSEILELVDKAGHGTGRLDTDQLKQFPVSVPPCAEQKAIAEALCVWDTAITTAEKLLANSRKQKQALMQTLLLDSRAQHERLSLSDISERVQRTSDSVEHPILMISSGSGFVRQDEKYSRFMAGKSLNDYILLKRGEFAYNKGNSKSYEFGCVFPLEAYEQGLVPHVYVCFKLDGRCDPDFFKYLFEADYLHDQLGAMVNTGVRNNGLLNVRPADFMSVKVPLPPMERQRYIAKVLGTASEEIRLLQVDLENLRTQKRALMADLLTGKRRVKLPPRAAHEPA